MILEAPTLDSATCTLTRATEHSADNTDRTASESPSQTQAVGESQWGGTGCRLLTNSPEPAGSSEGPGSTSSQLYRAAAQGLFQQCRQISGSWPLPHILLLKNRRKILQDLS